MVPVVPGGVVQGHHLLSQCRAHSLACWVCVMMQSQEPLWLILYSLSIQAVGEPPLFLASSIFFAIKDAIRAARAQHGDNAKQLFQLDSPATPEKIRNACVDQFTTLVGYFNQLFLHPRGDRCSCQENLLPRPLC